MLFSIFFHADFCYTDSLDCLILVFIFYYLYLLIKSIYHECFANSYRKTICLNYDPSIPTHKYLITIFTGYLSNSKTKLDLSIKLIGSKRSSMIYKLTKFDTNLFKSGSANSFLMSEFNPLGQIRSIRFYLSNPNSNKINKWFIRHVQVCDLTEKKEEYFIIYRWFVCDLNCVQEFDVAQKYDVKSFGHLFFENFGRLLMDMCPWMSVYFPKYYSDIPRYTKCQLIILLISFFSLIDYLAIEYKIYNNFSKITSDKSDQIAILSWLSAFLCVFFTIGIWFMLKKFYHTVWLYEQNSKFTKFNPAKLKLNLKQNVFEDTFEKLISEIKFIRMKKRDSEEKIRDNKPVFKINDKEVNIENNYLNTSDNLSFKDTDFNGLLLKPEVEDLNDNRKKSSGVYTIFSFLTDDYDLEMEEPSKRKKSTTYIDKLDDSIKISLFNFLLAKSFIWIFHLAIFAIVSFLCYTLIVFVYSFINALFIESHENDFFRPTYIEIDLENTSQDTSYFDGDKTLELNPSSNIILNTNAIELNDLNEQRKIHRLLEKDFFLNIAEIVLYIIFFLVILTFNYESTYIDLKVFSNEYLDTVIKANTSWTRINSFSSFIDWSQTEMVPLLKRPGLDHPDLLYNIFFKKSYHDNQFLFNSIRMSHAYEFMDDFMEENKSTSIYQRARFYEKLSHQAIRPHTTRITFHHFQVFGNKPFRPPALLNQTYLMMLEANLFNIETRVWTIVKASIEKNEKAKLVKKLWYSNLRETYFLKQNSEKIQPIKIMFIVMISLYSVSEGFQLNGSVEQFGWLKGFLLYATTLDNILDQCLILSSLFYISILAYIRFCLNKITSELLKINAEFYSLDFFVNMEMKIQFLCNFMIFIAFLKALSLLNFNPKTYLITDTLKKSFLDLALLLLFALFNYSLFAGIGNVLFKNDQQFSDFKTSLYTSILTVVRHVNFDLLIRENFFGLFVWQIIGYFYMQRTLINFVISVIITYFDQIRYTHKKSQTEETFSRMIKNAFDYFRISKN
ncbi:polycystic kidney disease 1-like 2 [Brachionus plicatilis]|uniref:Polycystic kidney disease 1-like 2 n=1 Tax=Brachionus plicatilis TaxID=10195 RepID=A0A3M7QWC7_BRAPC|nr:polycystic kidney disease 1-like 2 [Brachionus plicatilis]